MTNWSMVHKRRRIVRIIETAVLLYMMWAGIWSLCYVSDWALTLLGAG